MQTKTLRKIWARMNSVSPNNNCADLLLHSFIIVKFGKESLKELTEDETRSVLHWIDRLEEIIG
jgi:hypothetical protein